MERIIFHIDANKFYVSCELVYRPELRGKPVCVSSRPDDGSGCGIILTASPEAKSLGVKTAQSLWEAKSFCRDLYVIPANYPRYIFFSNQLRKIYEEYTDLIMPFGLDESWLDVTGSAYLFGGKSKLAKTICERIKLELGITVSIGVSFTKPLAKLGSDIAGHNEIFEISQDTLKTKVWQLPCSDLLYVGSSTKRKLNAHGLFTIGDIAKANPNLLEKSLGKMGYILHSFANGTDRDAVRPAEFSEVIKSIGNSVTTPRDLIANQDVKVVLIQLTDSVGRRLRDLGLKCKVVTISVRDNNLLSFTRQITLAKSTDISDCIAKEAFNLFTVNYSWSAPIRSIGVSVGKLISKDENIQLDMFNEVIGLEKQRKLDAAIDSVKKRFGSTCVQKAVVLGNGDLSKINPYDEHVVHPIGYFHK